MTHTSYCSAFMENNSCYCYQDFSDFIKKEQKFHYGKTDFQQFVKKYRSEGWILRKITAIPGAMYALARAVGNLALGILLGSPLALFDRGKYFKAQIFHLCRDLQEGTGRVISLFHDKSRKAGSKRNVTKYF